MSYMKESQRRKKVLYLQYTNPAAYPPLQHSSRILADAGWEVLFLGARAMGADALRFPGHRYIRVIQMPFRPGGWRQKLHYLGFVFWTFWWTLRWRPQWIYASDPLSAPAALLAGLLPGVRLLYHEHDSPSVGSSGVFIRWILALRKRLARNAEVVVLPNAQRGEVFSRETGIDVRKVHCVWNCPAREDALLEPEKARSGGMWLLFHGSIVPERLPTSLLDAMATLPETIKLRVIGYETIGSMGYLDKFLRYAKTLGLEERLHCLGPLNREELLLWGRRSHVGLAFMPANSSDLNMQHMTGASNKPFDYLACGCALLVSNLSDWNAMFVESGLGLNCDTSSEKSIAAAVQWFWDNPDLRRTMGKKGRQKIQDEYNYETQFEVIKKLLVGNAKGK